MFDKMSISEINEELLSQALQYSRNTRQCEGITDQDFLQLGVERVIGEHKSGRAFLQEQNDMDDGSDLSRATYFSAMCSKRRRQMVADSELGLHGILDRQFRLRQIDNLHKFNDINDFDVWAYDGHFREHACHAKKDNSGGYVKEGGIFALDLRTGLVKYIVTTCFDNRRSSEIKAFRQSFSKNVHKKKKKLICVADMAYTDRKFWSKLKDTRKYGAYLITCLREDINIVNETEEYFDRSDPVNIGVRHVFRAVLMDGSIFRKIVYIDPETDKEYTYITSLENVRPGVIAFLYFWRWKIEKVFDVFKNKLIETKAWGVSKEASDIQSFMISMTYNILLFIQDVLCRDQGLREEKLEQKREKEMSRRKTVASQNGKTINPLVGSAHSFFQMSLQFIRAFRNCLARGEAFMNVIRIFDRAMTSYI